MLTFLSSWSLKSIGTLIDVNFLAQGSVPLLSSGLNFYLLFCEPDDSLIFVNAGGSALTLENKKFSIQVKPDKFFQGGDVLRTDETIIEGGDIPSIYQSARYGNFFYGFENLLPGEYFVDLHFAEIIYTNGPKGMRLFDVFMQEEKASKPQ